MIFNCFLWSNAACLCSMSSLVTFPCLFCVLTAAYSYEHACVGYELSLDCSPPEVIYVLNATYGQCEAGCCEPQPGDCQVFVDLVVEGRLREIQDECDNKSSCRYLVGSEDLAEWCGQHFMDYLQVFMTCAPGNSCYAVGTEACISRTQQIQFY